MRAAFRGGRRSPLRPGRLSPSAPPGSRPLASAVARGLPFLGCSILRSSRPAPRAAPSPRPPLRDQRLGFLLRQLGSVLGPGPPAVGAPAGAPASRPPQALAGRGTVGKKRLVHRANGFRVAAARVEGPEPAAPFDQLTLLALRTRHAGALGGLLLDVFAVWVTRATDEGAEPAYAALERSAALRALLVQDLRLRPLRPVDLPGVRAHRVVGAPDEPAVPAEA